MKEDICWLCLRITPKQISRAVHKLSFSKDKKHDILQEAVSLVEKSYKKNKFFFCGKSPLRIIGGLMYLLSFKYCKEKFTMRSVGQELVYLSKGIITEPTIRKGYRDWIKIFPELEKYVEEYNKKKDLQKIRVSSPPKVYVCPLCLRSSTFVKVQSCRNHLKREHGIKYIRNIKTKHFNEKGILISQEIIDSIRLQIYERIEKKIRKEQTKGTEISETTTIIIDEEVWKYLNTKKQVGQRDSFNSVLRRLLGLNPVKPVLIQTKL